MMSRILKRYRIIIRFINNYVINFLCNIFGNKITFSCRSAHKSLKLVGRACKEWFEFWNQIYTQGRIWGYIEDNVGTSHGKILSSYAIFTFNSPSQYYYENRIPVFTSVFASMPRYCSP